VLPTETASSVPSLSSSPSLEPSNIPSISNHPSKLPSLSPSSLPSGQPSSFPTFDCEITELSFNTNGAGAPVYPGDYVSDEWLDQLGVNITATAFNVGFAPDGQARVFDSSNPHSADLDLGTPSRHCVDGGPGRAQASDQVVAGATNCASLGNVLIIQSGLFEEPNDSKFGGTLDFTFFPLPADVFQMGLLDMEARTHQIVATFDDGSDRVYEFRGLGDNTVQTVTFRDAVNVRSISLKLQSSGAVTSLSFCKIDVPTPAPTVHPTPEPTLQPSFHPSIYPTPEPTPQPSIYPTPEPTHQPSIHPTPEPTPQPSSLPSVSLLPSESPSLSLRAFVIDAISPSLPDGSLSQTDVQGTYQYDAVDSVSEVPQLRELLPGRIQQMFALFALYHATDGPSWTIDWTLETPAGFPHECDLEEWITCNNENQTVSIILKSKNLQSSLPAEISMLSKLENLNLARNNLTGFGGLPSEIGRMTSLTELALYENPIVGALPPALSQATALIDLNLCHNSITGILPSELATMQNLTQLNLHGNEITSIPREIFSMSWMDSFDFSFNQLAGEIPTGFAQMSALCELRLEGNSYTGPIPEIFGEMTDLHYLDLSNNELSGALPASLSSCSSLTVLYLENNNISNSIPPFYSFPFIEIMDVRNNSLTGTIPQALFEEHLWDFDVSYNNIREPIPDLLLATNLEFLSLRNNAFQQTIPSGISYLSNLRGLWLLYNHFSGTVPDYWSNHLSLEEFDVSNNDLTGSLPETLSASAGLLWIYFEQNDLNNTIPVDYSNWATAKDLWVYGNHLEGTVPSEICSIVESRDETNMYEVSVDCDLVWCDCCDCDYSGYSRESVLELRLKASLAPDERDAIDVPSSPQSNAYQWMRDTDMYDLLSLDTGRLQERYAMAVLSFSTFVTGWSDPLYKESWLNTTVDICEWYGVTCDVDGETTHLDFTSVNMHGQLPIELRLLSKLVSFVAYDNFLTEGIPTSWGSLGSLEVINLGMNSLTAGISSELCALNSLVELDVSMQRATFGGRLPDCLSQWSSMEKLALHDNSFTGPLPSLESWTSLKYLKISTNVFSGPLPPLSSNSVIREIEANDNRFNQTIPTTYGSKYELALLLLDENLLTGTVPVCPLVTNPYKPLSSANLTVDCTEVTCCCCEATCTPYRELHSDEAHRRRVVVEEGCR